mmetsp:Transcript_88738/g.228896  ORF Transcript_88738/g.228896 Transcript_88738/m.228896 type:complete len:476 (-) Transcript_88738:87-1514(-)
MAYVPPCPAGAPPARPRFKTVVFLDVDGVLHSLFGEDLFRDSCCSVLEHIVRLTGADIVLSSTWRTEVAKINVLNQVLQQWNIPTISDRTKELNTPREIEICEWLDRHPEVTRWIVIDDMDLDSAPTLHAMRLRGHFVRTCADIGLTWRDADIAVQLMRAQGSMPSAAATPVADASQPRVRMGLPLATVGVHSFVPAPASTAASTMLLPAPVQTASYVPPSALAQTASFVPAPAPAQVENHVPVPAPLQTSGHMLASGASQQVSCVSSPPPAQPTSYIPAVAAAQLASCVVPAAQLTMASFAVPSAKPSSASFAPPPQPVPSQQMSFMPQPVQPPSASYVPLQCSFGTAPSAAIASHVSSPLRPRQSRPLQQTWVRSGSPLRRAHQETHSYVPAWEPVGAAVATAPGKQVHVQGPKPAPAIFELPTPLRSGSRRFLPSPRIVPQLGSSCPVTPQMVSRVVAQTAPWVVNNGLEGR